LELLLKVKEHKLFKRNITITINNINIHPWLKNQRKTIKKQMQILMKIEKLLMQLSKLQQKLSLNNKQPKKQILQISPMTMLLLLQNQIKYSPM